MRVTHQFAAVLAVTLILQGGAGLFIMHRVEAASAQQEEALTRTAEIVTATERLSGLASQEVARLLGYLRGAATLEDVNATRTAFAQEADQIRAVSRQDSALHEHVNEIQRVESRLFEAPSPESEEPLFTLLKRTREVKAEVLEDNAQHRGVATGFMLAFGNPERNESMLNVLADIESGRAAVLEFEPVLYLDRSEATSRMTQAHAINSAIIRSLSGETATSMRTFIFQLEDMEKANADTDPDYSEAARAVRLDLMRLQNRVAATQWSQSADETEVLMKHVAENVTRAEALGVPVARADVPLVGSNVTEVDVLSRLVVEQLDLRQRTDRYFEMTLLVQSVVRGSLNDRVGEFEGAITNAVTVARVEAEGTKTEVTRDLATVRAAAGASILAVALPVGTLGALLVRNLNTRVRSFDDAACAVASGRFDAPPPPLQQDDFDPLVEAWASMTKGLAERDRELARKNAVLQQSERMATLGSLLAGVAHEINNPLAFVKGNEQLALDDVAGLMEEEWVKANPRLHEMLGEIHESLSANLSGIDRIENTNRALKGFAGPTQTNRESVDLNEVLEGVLIIAHNRLKSSFTVEKDLHPLPRVEASSQEIGQIILNLLINAAEACPDGGTITILTRSDGDHVRVTVEDDGPGVPDAMKERLFTMYATTKDGGTGLGLYISRSIAEGHGGSLELAEPEVGSGAAFSLSLPASHDAPRTVWDSLGAHAVDADAARAASGGAPGTAPQPPGGGDL